ncbi:hypothetical protein [Dyella sp. 20L07]|uniref:hypothetical protein n=1 Tax=Dyella sp. 20L07 TaxID=3384240 RepID=UPI003D290EAA
MKRLSKTLALAFLITQTFSMAAAATAASSTGVPPIHSGASPLLGSWSVDIARLPMPPEQRPKSVTFSFGDAGGSRWAVHVDIVYAPGQEVHSFSNVALDGTSAVIENSPEADLVTLKQPAPNVLVMALQKEGVLVSTRIYSVMPDGRSLVETAVYPGDRGTPIMKTNYFTRVQ